MTYPFMMPDTCDSPTITMWSPTALITKGTEQPLMTTTLSFSWISGTPRPILFFTVIKKRRPIAALVTASAKYLVTHASWEAFPATKDWAPDFSTFDSFG